MSAAQIALTELASMASLASLMMTRGVTNTRGVRRSKKDASPEMMANASTLSSVINPRILNGYRKKIEEALHRWENEMSESDDDNEIHAIEARAERAICDFLNRIRNRNKGKLPNKKLQDMWDSFKCVNSY